MVTGVTDGYRKTLEIVGVGYRVQARGQNLEFSLGYSHPVTVTPPEGITFRVEAPTRFVVEGIDKQQVGEIAAQDPQAAQARPVQGQGRAVPGRADSPQGREGWEVAMASTKTRSRARSGRRLSARAASQAKRHLRVRKKVTGSPQRPRLVVNRSARHMFAQIVDDTAGRTLASASSLDADIRGGDGDKTAKARQVGELLARRAAEAGITAVVFDRGGYAYHGRLAALADAAREGGLDF